MSEGEKRLQICDYLGYFSGNLNVFRTMIDTEPFLIIIFLQFALSEACLLMIRITDSPTLYIVDQRRKNWKRCPCCNYRSTSVIFFFLRSEILAFVTDV